MLIDGVSGKTLIERVRMRHLDLDPLVARLRLEALLTSVDLRPPSLSPSAIVCVRRLHDPLPRRLKIGRAGAQPPGAWVQSARSRLDDLVRHAARPVHEPVPPSAEAVLFADRAELLLCLTRCWLNGDTVDNWWWQSLVPLAARGSAFVEVWLAQPQVIPAALAALTSTGQGAVFVRALPASVRRTMLVRVAQTFGLPALSAALDELLNREAAFETQAESVVFRSDEQPTPPHTIPLAQGERVVEPVWRRWLPTEQRHSLQPAQELLLGISLMIHHACAQVERPDFIPHLRRWYAAAQPVRPPMLPTAPADIAVLEAPPRSNDQSADAIQTIAAETQAQALPMTDTIIPADGGDAPSLSALTDEPPPADISQGAAAATETDWETTLIPAAGETTYATPVTPPIEAWVVSPTMTEYGGLFYLLNVALALNLYGDFTRPLHPGLALPIWDFLTLFGREWLGEALIADPFWRLLGRLAGRETHIPPGADFEPPRSWRLPLDWLDAFPERDGWRWNAANGRLVVYHPAGFYVVDVPRRGETAKQLSRVLQPYAVDAVRDRALKPPRTTDPLARWVGWMAAYLNVRLARALGTADIGGALLRYSARLYVSSTELDIVFDLADMSLAARLAGLDRDPGWIPAAGRIIRFHFRDAAQ
jgi:hypothetical protein